MRRIAPRHRIPAVALDQGEEAALAGANRGELGAEVAERAFRHADVHRDDVDQLPVELARALQLQDRNLQPLGVDVGGDALQRAADIEPVRHAAGEPDQLALVVDRQAQRDVVEVAAGDIGVVGDQDVAGLDPVGAEMRELGLERLGHAADEHRQAQPDRDRLALRGEQPDGEVERLVDDHVVGGAHEVGLHLLGHRHDPVAHQLGGHRVVPGVSAPFSAMARP